jgi:hypothetical protein
MLGKRMPVSTHRRRLAAFSAAAGTGSAQQSAKISENPDHVPVL